MFKIAHISDQQIRMFKRHKEFKESFAFLYASLKEQKPDIIVFAGDILHEKTHISPETVDMCANHFRSLSEIAPLYVIPGNHDGNLNNLTRMDSLTPIVRALNSDRIHYLKDSGVYPIHIPGIYLKDDIHSKDNFINLVVFSCFDDEDKWPKNCPHTSILGINIGVFHGMVQGAKLQNGQIVEECPNKLSQFLDIVDYLLLGDIHKHQILDMHYRAAYCGSFPQQNYSETIEKGYLIWNIETKKKHSLSFIKLPNVCPFYTIELDTTLAVPLNLELQKRARIRIISRPLTSAEKKSIEGAIKLAYEPIEIAFSEPINNQKAQILIDPDVNVKAENLEDPAIQEKLYKDFFAEYNLSENTLKEIMELNKKYDIKSKTEEDIKRNIQYKILKSSWSNVFSYGEDNVIDFTKLKGIVGVFGKNGVGKSSAVVDIPGYTIFNKISKKGVVKNDLIINENKEDCGAEVEILLDQDRYIITRATHVYSKPGKDDEVIIQGKTDVDFKVIHSDGTIEVKNGEQRQDTEKAIRSIFGTPEDSMATSVAPQWQLLGLLEAGGTERQKLIGRYFDIDIFDQKNKLAKEDWKQIKNELKLYENKNLESELIKSQNALKQVVLLTAENKKRLAHLHVEIDKYREVMTRKEKNVTKFEDKTNSLNFERQTVIDKVALLDSKIVTIKKYPCVANPDCCLLKDVKDNEDKKSILQEKLNKTLKLIEENTKNLKEYQEKNKLSDDEKACGTLEWEADGLSDTLYDLAKKEGMLLKSVEQMEKDKVEFEKIKHIYQIYDYFLLATSKDGISKNIISKNLHIINSQIKKILSNEVSFELELASIDDGKAVEIFFKHEKNKPRRIELCSGAEKTISAIAIRAALVSMTTLPRSNLFTLDEVFTSLDPEYMDAMVKMLEYLKELFDTVVIITHLDAFKDIVDHSIQIIRDDNGYSRIVN